MDGDGQSDLTVGAVEGVHDACGDYAGLSGGAFVLRRCRPNAGGWTGRGQTQRFLCIPASDQLKCSEPFHFPKHAKIALGAHPICT